MLKPTICVIRSATLGDKPRYLAHVEAIRRETPSAIDALVEAKMDRVLQVYATPSPSTPRGESYTKKTRARYPV